MSNLHKWESVSYNMNRMEVPGGWIYEAFDDDKCKTIAMVFVPNPVQIKRQAENTREAGK
jgi:hypothetical protein